MPKKNIVVMGGSTGSFDVFKRVARDLPEDLDAAVFIVWHMSPNIRGILPEILNNMGPLPAKEAEDGEAMKRGMIYVARPDHHLLLENSYVRVTRGPKENLFRPAVDPLFRSAAYEYGPRAVGIITSGALDDGTSGLWSIKMHGGTTVAQDPDDAEIPSMPESAISQITIDHVVPASEIASLIVRLSKEETTPEEDAMMKRRDERLKDEIGVAAEDRALQSRAFDVNALSPFTCPECSGVLAKIRDGDRVRFRCHTGHAFSTDALLSSLTEKIEESIWKAVRGVDESIMLLNHIGDHFAEINQAGSAAQFFQKANEARRRNELLRSAIFNNEHLTIESVEEEAPVSRDNRKDRAAEASP
jgi:two-component system chemotaxis response regulator CheB